MMKKLGVYCSLRGLANPGRNTPEKIRETAEKCSDINKMMSDSNVFGGIGRIIKEVHGYESPEKARRRQQRTDDYLRRKNEEAYDRRWRARRDAL
ncbi:MAG: tRNA-dependent cyclodipeptide synthase [Beijerinckiaceae bacterium]|jgi:hypothetical protein|nr:tRNA-dependent cyclodipeptide synthase [Beijerinckiaceae bacterium]